MTLHLSGHTGCPQCARNLRIIEHCHTFIDKAAMEGMLRSEERVAVFVEFGKKTAGFHAIPIKRLLEMESDEELKAAYQKSSESLGPGEILVITAFLNEEHFGFYKLLPGLLN